MRINILRVFLGTIDGLLYFELNSSARCPRADEDELPIYWELNRPSRTEGSRPPVVVCGWGESPVSLSGGLITECGWGLGTTLLAGARRYPMDNLPVLGTHNCGFLGQHCTAANQLILRIRSDLVHRGANGPTSFSYGSSTEGGSHVKLCFCQQAESSGSLTWLSIASRFLSLHLICIWDIN